jgi:hypothetical protein
MILVGSNMMVSLKSKAGEFIPTPPATLTGQTAAKNTRHQHMLKIYELRIRHEGPDCAAVMVFRPRLII